MFECCADSSTVYVYRSHLFCDVIVAFLDFGLVSFAAGITVVCCAVSARPRLVPSVAPVRAAYQDGLVGKANGFAHMLCSRFNRLLRVADHGQRRQAAQFAREEPV